MSYFTRDAIEEIRDAGRGHLIPDYDLYDIYGGPEEEDDDRDAVDARIDAGDGDV